MAQTFTVPSHTYSVGTTAFGPFSINAGTSNIKLSVKRDTTLSSPGVEVLRIEAVCSFDGGVTWLKTTAPGGDPGVLGNPDTDAVFFGMDGDPTVPLDRNGQPVPDSSVSTSITTPCQVKGQMVVSHALTTTISVILT